VTSESGYAETYRGPMQEDAIRLGGATNATDRCFRMAESLDSTWCNGNLGLS
jgi:hypothetical protein